MAGEYMLLKDAQVYLGTSKTKMWRLVKDGILPVYSDPLDKRKKLVKKADLDNLRHPHKS